MKLWVKILIAVVLGVITGQILQENAVYLRPIGTIFLNLVNMIIVLLVLASMTIGVTSIHDPKKLGRLGIKTLLLYLSTTIIAMFLGIFFGKLFGLGTDLGLSAGKPIQLKDTPSLGQMLMDIIPSNPVASMASGNMLQVIVFAVFLGIAINFSGKRGRPLRDFLESLADVMYRLTSIIMEFSPVGVFAIMAYVSGSMGLAVFWPLIELLLVFYFVCVLHILIVFCGLIRLAKLSIPPFFKGMGDAMMMAFSTCSSSATLPVSMHCAQQNLGISKNITSFVLPLGSTVNMNGLAIFMAMAPLFIANAYGIELSFTDLLTIVAMGTLSAVGAAGIPGAGFIMMTVVFSSVGLPLEGLGVIIGIDRLREMVSTVLNILGDTVVALYLAKSEGELNERQYYNPELVELEEPD